MLPRFGRRLKGTAERDPGRVAATGGSASGEEHAPVSLATVRAGVQATRPTHPRPARGFGAPSDPERGMRPRRSRARIPDKRTRGDVAQRLREPVGAALLVAALVIAPLGATLVFSWDTPSDPSSVGAGTRRAVVTVPGARLDPGATLPRPILVAAGSASVPDAGSGTAISPTKPARRPDSAPPGASVDDPPEPPPTPEPGAPVAAVSSRVDDVVDEAEEAVEQLPLPEELP
jgi:hypothetical protein